MKRFITSLICFLLICIVSMPCSFAATIQKGLAGAQDMSNYDGVNPTFDRDTSLPGITITLNKVGYEVDALVVYGGGVAYTQATLTSALTAIGTTNKVTLMLRPGTWAITANADYSAYANVTFRIVPGALLQIATGTTTTIPLMDENGLHQRFNCVGTGKVVFGAGAVKEVPPEWWATNTIPGTTDMTAALQAWLNTGGALFLPASTYKFTTTLTVPATVSSITGQGATSSILAPSGCNGLTFTADATGLYNPRVFKDFAIIGTGTGAKTALVSLGSASIADKLQHAHFTGLRIANFGKAANFRNLWWARFWNNVLYPVHAGIDIVGQNVHFLAWGNHIEYGTVAGASGDKYGIRINSASDYDPGGTTEKSPEDTIIDKHLIYGFDKAIDIVKATIVRITDGDFDNTKVVGVSVGAVTDGFQLERTWIGLDGATGTHGVNMIALGGGLRGPNKISNVTVSPAGAISGTIAGIVVGTNQTADVEANYISSINGNGIRYDGGSGNIIGNTVSSTGNSINVVNSPANSVIIIDKNGLSTAPVINATNNNASIDIRNNSGQGSTYIRGSSTITNPATSVTKAFSTLYGPPKDFWPIATAKIYPVCRILNADKALGAVWGDASANGVTIHVTTTPATSKKIFWEIIAVPTIEYSH